MHKRWICSLHSMQYEAYKPWFLRHWIMKLFGEPVDNLWTIDWAKVYISGNKWNEQSLSVFFPGDFVYVEYTDVHGHYNVVQAIVGSEDEDGVLSLKFSKPVSLPDKNENVYLKLGL